MKQAGFGVDPFAGAFDHLLRIYEKAILLRRDNLCAS
jgi:hypothetical protein